MPPRAVTRTVRLRQPPRSSAYTERLKLLTYPMALAKRGATVPLIHSPTMSAGQGGGPATRLLADTLSCFNRGGGGGGARPPPSARAQDECVQGPSSVAAPSEEDGDAKGAQTLPAPRRWVRDADELCVASIHRSNNINRINSYVATYKLDDPQWRPLLLPEVHVLPKANTACTDTSKTADVQEQQPTNHSRCLSSSAASSAAGGYDVFIDYNKLTTLELMSRHSNYALRHLVQKGHAMYLVTFAQHSVAQMRGVVEASYISCAYGIRGERLRTHIIHTGPVDVREVLEVDPVTLRVSFNLQKRHVRRGVVAVSTVEGYGTWFQRKPMLWQRTRRIGALQSQMGSYDYQLCDCADVGRLRPYEVSLLAPHVRQIGAHGGADAIALIASSQIAQNERLYMGQFEAPVLTAVDSVHQLIHRTALHHQLLRPAVTEEAAGDAAAGAPVVALEDPRLQELRRLAGMERFLPVSWVTRTPPPYVPLESDLPFRIQLSRPAVIHTDAFHTQPGCEADTNAAVVFPTGGSVGSPFVKGVPLSLFEYNIHQGVDHYIFDDAPSARPLKWWNQKSNMPYSGYVYGMRSGLLDHVEPAEKIRNPLAPPATAAASATPAKSGSLRKRRAARVQQRSTSAGRTTGTSAASPSSTEEGADAVQRASMSPSSSPRHADDAGDSRMLSLAAEELAACEKELTGYEEDSRQEASLAWRENGMDASVEDRPPLHTLVAPTTAARRRLQRYAKASSAPLAAGTASSSTGTLDSRADTLLQRLRRRRLRRRRQSAQGASPLRPEEGAPPPDATSDERGL